VDGRDGEVGTGALRVAAPLLALTVAVVLAASGCAAAEEVSPGRVTATFLANEGFLIGDSTRSVIVDGFVTEAYSKYGAVDASTWERMLAREAPFENVVLALVSHVHRDHFQRKAAMAFLLAHPETTLVSSPNVRLALESEPGFETVAGRVRSLEPGWGETLSFETDGVRVEFLHLPHGGRPWSEIHNFGHVISIGGKSIMHIGDAQQDPEPYEAAGLGQRVFDIALIPYWMYASSEGTALRQSHLRGRSEIAAHIPPRERERVAEGIGGRFPAVQVPARALQTFGVP